MDKKILASDNPVVRSEDVRDYLDQKMAPEVRQAFELRMFAEPVVAEMVELERQLREGLKHLRRPRTS